MPKGLILAVVAIAAGLFILGALHKAGFFAVEDEDEAPGGVV